MFRFGLNRAVIVAKKGCNKMNNNNQFTTSPLIYCYPGSGDQPPLLLPQHRGPAGDQDSLQEVAAHTERWDWPDVKQARENTVTYFKRILRGLRIILY